MGPIWVLSAPDGPHVGPMNLAIWDNHYVLKEINDSNEESIWLSFVPTRMMPCGFTTFHGTVKSTVPGIYLILMFRKVWCYQAITWNNVDLASVRPRMTFVSGQLHNRYLNFQSSKLAWKLLKRNLVQIIIPQYGKQLLVHSKKRFLAVSVFESV